MYMILIGNVHIVGKYKGNKGQGEGPSWSLGLARGETKLNCKEVCGLASVSNLVPTVANGNYLNTFQLERAEGISRTMENG